MITKKESLEIYFLLYPLHLQILQDKENGMTERKLGKKYAAQGADFHCIGKIRKSLIKAFESKSWKIVCREAVTLGLINQNPQLEFNFNPQPCDYLLDIVARYEDQVEKKNKEWAKERKLLRWK